MEKSTIRYIGQGWRLAMAVSTRSIVGGHRVLGKIGGRGKRTRIGERDLCEVEGLLWCFSYESASSIGHPSVETFASDFNPEVTMIQIAVELIPEFLEDFDPRLCLVAFDLHSFELALTVY